MTQPETLQIGGEMKMSGQDVVSRIAIRLREEKIPYRDTDIVNKLRSLTVYEMAQLVNLGDVSEWHNERVIRARNALKVEAK